MTSLPSTTALLSFSGANTSNRPRLYCFAYAGGSSSVFAPWGKELASEVAVFGVDLPGHGSCFRNALADNIEAMAAEAAKLIQNAELGFTTERFAFYGHSLGAIIAFETARLLDESTRATLTHLLVGAARAPGLSSPVPPISHLDDAGFLDAVQARYGGLPAILFEEPELLAMVMPVLRADFRAYEGYISQPGIELTVPITAFFGAQDEIVTSALMDPWRNMTSGPFLLQAMQGGHFFLNECRESLIAAIRKSLNLSLLPSEFTPSGNARSSPRN